MLNKNKPHLETLRFGPQSQDSDSSFVSDSEGDRMPITKKAGLKSLIKGSVHSTMKNKPQHANTVKTVAMIHSPQESPDPTLASIVDKKKAFRISNAERGNKKVPEIKDCRVELSRNVGLIMTENQIDTRKENRSQNVLSRKRSSSESSVTSIIGSSDSDESIVGRKETYLPNLKEKRKIDFAMVKRKDHELISSTPLHKNAVNLKNNNWPSPISVVSSHCNIITKRNFSFADFRNSKLICSTPIPERGVSQDQRLWPSRKPGKKSTKLQNGNLNCNSDNTYSMRLHLQENFNPEQPVQFLQQEQELRLLKRRSSYLMSNKNGEGKIGTAINQSVDAEDAENMKKLKQSMPDKIDGNVRKTRVDEDVTARSPKKKSNSNKMSENKNKSPAKDKQNSPHKERSSTDRMSRSVSGRKRLATSVDDQMNNSESEKKDDSKGKKASLRNSGRKGKKTVEVPENGDGLRRSTRIKVKPVSYWKGERVKYKMGSDNLLHMVGVKPGRQHLNYDFDETKKKRIQFAHVLSTVQNPERKLIPVPIMGKERNLECFSTLRFDGNLTESPNEKVRVFTGLEVPGIEAGYISIDPSSYIKDTAHDSIEFVFCIITGTVSVTIHNTEQELKKGEFFYVTKGVKYKIKNMTESEAVLFYTKIEK